MALTKKQSWCRRMSPPSEAHFRFLSGGCVLWRVFGASLSLSWSKCFCVTEDGRNVFLSWNSDPAILWCPQGLHWVDFNRALWNFDHLISTYRCQSLSKLQVCWWELVHALLIMQFLLKPGFLGMNAGVSEPHAVPAPRQAARRHWRASGRSWFHWCFLYESSSYHFKWFPVWVMFQNA